MENFQRLPIDVLSPKDPSRGKGGEPLRFPRTTSQSPSIWTGLPRYMRGLKEMKPQGTV